MFGRRKLSSSLTSTQQRAVENLTRSIDNCTSEMLMSVDWAGNLELVDAVNRVDAQLVLYETVRAVRKRLQSSKPKVVLLALNLIETLVKNCQANLHKEVGSSEKFMNIMEKLVDTHRDRRGRESMEIVDKALELIQTWALSFQPQHREMPFFSNCYQSLQRKGIRFPERQTNIIPIIPNDNPREEKAAAAGSSAETSKLETQVESTVDMLTSMMGALTSQDSSDAALVDELAQQCRTLQPQMVELVQTTMAANLGGLEQVLKLNDSLHTVLAKYTNFKSNDPPAPAPAPAPAPPPPPAPEPQLLDFDLPVSVSASSGSATSSAVAPPVHSSPPMAMPVTNGFLMGHFPTAAPPAVPDPFAAAGAAPATAGLATQPSDPFTLDPFELSAAPAAPSLPAPSIMDPFSSAAATPALFSSSSNAVLDPFASAVSDPFASSSVVEASPGVTTAPAGPPAAPASNGFSLDPFGVPAAPSPALKPLNPSAQQSVFAAATNAAAPKQAVPDPFASTPSKNPFD